MRAIVVRVPGDPSNLRTEQVPDPTPGSREVIVRLSAAALNHRDLNICRGLYAGLRFPIIPGSDGVGEVAAGGSDAPGVRVGDKVVINPSLEWGDSARIPGPNWRILGLPDDGTFAELVKVPADSVIARPAALSDEEAAAIPLAGLTAYRAIMTRGRVRPGETVAVLGIGGGVASLALLMARNAGARVFVTSGSDAKLERAMALGAVAGFNYRTQDWVSGIRDATDGGPDLIVDGTGGEIFGHAIDLARPGGRVVTYGSTLGPTPEIVVRRIFWKHLDVLGTTMGSPADFRGMLDQFGPHGLRPIVDAVFPLEEAGAALVRMESSAQFGKIVLRIE